MSATTEIKCDSCQADLTYSGNSIDWRLVLASQPKGYYPDAVAVTDVMIEKPVDEAKHFCGIRCLRGWLQDAPA